MGVVVTPEHGDVVIGCHDGSLCVLYTFPHPPQFLVAREESVDHAVGLAKRLNVRVWLDNGHQPPTLLEDFRQMRRQLSLAATHAFAQ
jgi:hypothetical protein